MTTSGHSLGIRRGTTESDHPLFKFDTGCGKWFNCVSSFNNILDSCLFVFAPHLSPPVGIRGRVGQHVGRVRQGSLFGDGVADQVSTHTFYIISSAINISLFHNINEFSCSSSSFAFTSLGTWTSCLTWRTHPTTAPLMPGNSRRCAPATAPTRRNANKPSPKCQK